MINGLNSMDSLFSNNFSSSNLLGGASSLNNFGSAFDQAMVQAKTPGDKAKVALAEARYSNLNDLFNMENSDSASSVLGFSMNNLFGSGGLFGVPSWAYDLQRILGNNSNISQIMNLNQQAAFAAQSSLNNELSNIGLGGGVNSII
ncbi:MAG TPA: hypothetical protein VIJ93_02105 [bacterium]